MPPIDLVKILNELFFKFIKYATYFCVILQCVQLYRVFQDKRAQL